MEDSLPHLFVGESGFGEDMPCQPFAIADDGEEDVLGADVGVVHVLGFLARHGEDFFDAGCVGEVAFGVAVGARYEVFLDAGAQVGDVDVRRFQHADGYALFKLEQAEENVFGSDVVVAESIRFAPGEGEYLLCSWCEGVHVEMVVNRCLERHPAPWLRTEGPGRGICGCRRPAGFAGRFLPPFRRRFRSWLF